jgi:hypothetical protein
MPNTSLRLFELIGIADKIEKDTGIAFKIEATNGTKFKLRDETGQLITIGSAYELRKFFSGVRYGAVRGVE